jgi:hypothetical protein
MTDSGLLRPELPSVLDLTQGKFVEPATVGVSELTDKLNMSSVGQIPDPIEVVDMPPLQRHGVLLAWGVLGGIGALGFSLLICVGINEFGAPSKEVEAALAMAQNVLDHCTKEGCNAENVQKVYELMTKISEAKRASRDFWTSFSQFILLNLLLPVLTSILGYVFGTTKKDT